MNPIIYIAGKIADELGSTRIEKAMQAMANEFNSPISVLVHGHSKYHSTMHWQFNPEPMRKLES